MVRIGITGHMNITPSTATLIRAELVRLLAADRDAYLAANG